jgi:hypothetical protein
VVRPKIRIGTSHTASCCFGPAIQWAREIFSEDIIVKFRCATRMLGKASVKGEKDNIFEYLEGKPGIATQYLVQVIA